VERMDFSSERTVDWFFDNNSKLRFHLLHFQCSLWELEAKLDATSNEPSENSRLHLTCTTINTNCKTMHGVMAAKFTGLTQKSAILWQLVAGSCTTCCFLS